MGLLSRLVLIGVFLVASGDPAGPVYAILNAVPANETSSVPSGTAAIAQTPSAPEAAIPVRVTVAGPAPDAGNIHSTGTLTYKREITLSFKTGGVVKAYAVDIGDPVHAGDSLIMADPTDVAGRRGEAEAAFAQAKANLERAEQLAKSGFASDARVEDARAAFKRAQSAFNSAKYDEGKAALTAPADGVVLSRHAEIGQQMAPGAPVITVGDSQSGLIMTVPLSDRQIVRVRNGDRAGVRLAAASDALVAAQVTRLASKADRVTGAFDAEVALKDAPPGLRSGLVGDVEITPSVKDGSEVLMAVPAIALLEGRGDLGYVYVVGPDNKAKRVAVVIDRILGDRVLLKHGLKRGERVVTSGAAYLRNGQPVSATVDEGLTPPKPSAMLILPARARP